MNRIAIVLAIAATCLGAYSCKSSGDGQKGAGIEVEMIELPSGNFTMGLSPDNRTFVKGAVAQEVALDGFAISAKPVSQALWTKVMGSNPSSVKNPDAPVDMVSWNDVRKFIKKYVKLTGQDCSLPTEAQWEYACNQVGKLGFVAVSEWCGDTFDAVPAGATKDDYFDPMTLMVNPCGPSEGDVKVVRNPSERIGIERHTKKAGVGFRLVRLTDDKLTGTMLAVLDGNSLDRETVDASVQSPEEFTIGDVTFRMVKVKGGSFQMGFSPESAPRWSFALPENESPAHKVTVDDFEIGETEVTVGLWNAVMGSVPYLDVEQRFFLHRIQVLVELLVVLFLQLGWFASPQRLDAVDYMVLIRVYVFSVLPLLLLAEYDRDRHELAVFAKKLAYLALRTIVLCGIVIQEQGYDRTAVFLGARPHFEFRIPFAAPKNRFGTFLPRQRFDRDFPGNHEGGIETESEMTDNILVLVFLEEFPC